ncbi:hypothetical protein M0802_006744, partial [Mischocyttarus mexicanus]
MNDSFLEDLDLLPNDKRSSSGGSPIDRHVTVRHTTTTSSPLQRISEQDDFEKLVMQQQQQQQKTENTSSKVSKLPQIRESNKKDLSNRDVKNVTEHDTRKQQMVKATKTLERKDKGGENKLKSMENKFKSDVKEKDNKQQQEGKIKTSDNKIIIKDSNRRSGGNYKDNTRSVDSSSKENSRPSDSSKVIIPHMDVTKERGGIGGGLRGSEGSAKKSETTTTTKEYDPVVLLNAIKDLISTYTKQESNKLLRAMHELHINSQKTSIRNMLLQTDEITKQIHTEKDSTRMKAVMDENIYLHEELVILQKRYNDLLTKLGHLEFLQAE